MGVVLWGVWRKFGVLRLSFPHKSHDALDIYPTMHHFIKKRAHMCTFPLQNSALWDVEIGALWDLHNPDLSMQNFNKYIGII